MPQAHRLLSLVQLQRRQYEQALAETEQAIALNSNFVDSYWQMGDILNFAGRPQEAIRWVEQAMRLNPRYPAWYSTSLGFAYLLMGRYEEAITILKTTLSRIPHYPPAYGNLAVCYAELGREAEARAAAAELLRLSPYFSLEAVRQRLPCKSFVVNPSVNQW
ncbi:MAG: tetratricopeptide repeat protein [Deltaproteobacteria bacterium]|nr:tetratricopeptide repeat protein [Deltaproteobacteria bacterium]